MLVVGQAERQKALRELALVSDGIKYAKVGFDDADRENMDASDEAHLFAGRPLTRPRYHLHLQTF